MPRMDGFEFIRALHGRPGATCPPVIASSCFASRVDHLRTQSAGFEGHLDKPFDDVCLLAAVGTVIGRRGISYRPPASTRRRHTTHRLAPGAPTRAEP